MQLDELQTEFEATFTELSQLVSKFDKKQLNTKPVENQWSAAQIAEHLIKANSKFPMMVSGQSKTTTRNSSEKIDKIKADFLNFETKVIAADFLVPDDRDYEKDYLINSLEQIRSDISQRIKQIDMSKTFTDFEFPVYGHLTGLETLAFIVYHTQRHIHQMKFLEI